MKKSNLIKMMLLLIAAGMITFNSCKEDEEDIVVDPDVTAYNAASVTTGGKLYDKFYATETSWTAPSGITKTDITGFGDFYRCKGCHGWDQLGSVASYIDRGPKVTRPSVASNNVHAFVNLRSNKEVFNAIKNTGGAAVDVARTADGTNASLGGNKHPDYSTILSDSEIWDLVKFLKEGALDVTLLYDIVTAGTYPTGSRSFTNVGLTGDATKGAAYYSTNCANCHGTTGEDPVITASIGKTMGKFIRTKPYEIQHKAVYGNLGSSMTGDADASFSDIKNMLKALSDTTNFPD